MVRELITVEGVDRSFGPTDVLQDINLIVNDGDRIGIVGHNGAGKTTLLNTISEQKQDVGEIDFAPEFELHILLKFETLNQIRPSKRNSDAKDDNSKNWRMRLHRLRLR